MEYFSDKCILKIMEKGSPIIVGLDPNIENFPTEYKENFTSVKEIGNTIFLFNKKIIDAIHDLIPGVKPQIAFYERFGIEGLKAYIKTIKYAQKKGLFVIGDVKRNDIDSTAKAYSTAHLSEKCYNNFKNNDFNVDAITINPYFGTDGIVPFINDVIEYGKGIFILVKTTNKSSVEFQDLIIETTNKEKKKLHEQVATYVNEWGKNCIGKYGFSSVGAVVGGTFPEEIKVLRKIMPHTLFLVPGIGAQGGKEEDVKYCFNKEKLGAIINVSRSVIFAYLKNKNIEESNFAFAARQEVIRLNQKINSVLD